MKTEKQKVFDFIKKYQILFDSEGNFSVMIPHKDFDAFKETIYQFLCSEIETDIKGFNRKLLSTITTINFFIIAINEICNFYEINLKDLE